MIECWHFSSLLALHTVVGALYLQAIIHCSIQDKTQLQKLMPWPHSRHYLAYFETISHPSKLSWYSWYIGYRANNSEGSNRTQYKRVLRLTCVEERAPSSCIRTLTTFTGLVMAAAHILLAPASANKVAWPPQPFSARHPSFSGSCPPASVFRLTPTSVQNTPLYNLW